LHLALGSAHHKRTLGVGCHIHLQLAFTQVHPALIAIEVDIHRAAGVEGEQAAIGQFDGFALAGGRLVIGRQPRQGRHAIHQTRGTQAEHQQQQAALQGLFARWRCTGQQRPTYRLQLPRAAPLNRLQIGYGSLEHPGDPLPRSQMCRVFGQPRLEHLTLRRAGLAGLEAQHPVNGGTGGRVNLGCTHGLSAVCDRQ